MKDLSFLEDNYVPRKTESNLVKRQNYAKCSTEGPKQRSSMLNCEFETTFCHVRAI